MSTLKPSLAVPSVLDETLTRSEIPPPLSHGAFFSDESSLGDERINGDLGRFARVNPLPDLVARSFRVTSDPTALVDLAIAGIVR